MGLVEQKIRREKGSVINHTRWQTNWWRCFYKPACSSMQAHFMHVALAKCHREHNIYGQVLEQLGQHLEINEFGAWQKFGRMAITISFERKDVLHIGGKSQV